MENFKKYYEKTINKDPSSNLQRFFINKYNEKLDGNLAVDIGCGAGNDTEFLLSKGFKVIAVDKEEQVRRILESKKLDSNNLKIIIDDFTNIDYTQLDLVNANFCLHFIKNNFDVFIKKILNDSIKTKGFFVGNFLGNEDEWLNVRTTVEKNNLYEYFKDYDILYFSEEKYYKDAIEVKDKFWHIYNIIAQKKK